MQTALLSALAALVCAACLFVGGCVVGESRAKGDQAVQDKQQMAVDVKRTESVHEAASSADSTGARETVRVITKFKPIDREVIRYVQTHADRVCLDADGVRIWRAANRGEFADTGAASGGHAAMPGDARPGERDEQRASGESHGDGAELSRLQDTPGEPSPVDQQRSPGTEGGAE